MILLYCVGFGNLRRRKRNLNHGEEEEMREKAQLSNRVIAALIDGLIAWVFVVIPVIGGIVSVVYILLKDAILYQITKDEQWKNKSIGKKIMSLEVQSLAGETIDFALSAKRNITITLGNFIAIIPLIGWIIGPIVAMILVIIELVLLLSDNRGQRLGDRWAKTTVVSTVVGATTVDVKPKDPSIS